MVNGVNTELLRTCYGAVPNLTRPWYGEGSSLRRVFLGRKLHSWFGLNTKVTYGKSYPYEQDTIW